MNSNSQSFLGRYRLVKVLGQGAMGVVYEAVDTRLNRTVAIKTVLRTHLADESTASEYASRFEREAQAAARLSHPHVVTVYDFGEHEDISYIVMEFIRGRELNQAFEAGEKFPLSEAVRIMCELLKALDYAHQQGIVHRDVKPANVMLDPGGRVKLTDFGVARVANANQDRTMPGTLVGTPSYMSPEQILGTAVGSRTDIFAAGVILYQFLTGRRPFSGGGPFGVQRKIVQDDPEPPSKINPAVPPGFDIIISRALAKLPENRYENAGAFAADLERIGATLEREVPLIDLDLAGEPAPPPPPPPPPPPAPAPALTFGASQPFGTPPAPPQASADEPPFDPEATVIMFRPQGADTTTGHKSLSLPQAAGLSMHATHATRPSTMATTTQRPPPPAPAPPPPPPPPAAPARAAAPAARAPAPAPAARPAARQSSTAPAYAPRRPLVPMAAGAGVALLALTVWLVVSRPWSSQSSSANANRTPVTVPVAPPPAAPTPSAPAATTPSPAPPPATRPVPTETAPVATPAPAPTPAPRRSTPEAQPRPPRAEPARAEPARPAGVEPRCSDLLQRMQLGEPLTTEQTAFFQSRCTR